MYYSMSMRAFELMDILVKLAGTHRRNLPALAVQLAELDPGSDPTARELLAETRSRLQSIMRQSAFWARCLAKQLAEYPRAWDRPEEVAARIDTLDENLLQVEIRLPERLLCFGANRRLFEDTKKACGVPFGAGPRVPVTNV